MEDNFQQSTKEQIINQMLNELDNSETKKRYILPDEETIKKCKELVSLFVETGNNIKKLQFALKDQKDKYKKVEKELINIMSIYGLEQLNNKNIRIKCNTSETKLPVTSQQIKEKISELDETFLKYNSKNEIINHIFKNQPISTKSHLKILKNR